MTITYLDHSATTPLDPAVLAAMQPAFTTGYGNASSVHSSGQAAAGLIAEARLTVAQILHCAPPEIIFTSGGTESDNLALLGVARAHGPGHIITSAIEHHAVLHPLEQLTKEGFEISLAPVTPEGLIDLDHFQALLRPDTFLVSVMSANNEIGTIQPLSEISAIVKPRGILLHTDAVQAAGFLPLAVDELGVDLLSLSAHKFYGPKGVGLLYCRTGIPLQPIMWGGNQERSRRPSTYNTPGIVGLAAALRLVEEHREAEVARLTSLRDYTIHRLLTEIPHVQLNGHPQHRLANNINISVHKIEGEAMILRLDIHGFMVSSGSACTSGALDPSHVLLAIGLDHATAHGSLRISLGRSTTRAELDRFVETLKDIVTDLRALSPLT